MKKMRPELISSDAGKRLTQFCLDYFGTIKNAAIYLGVPYLTLWRNCKNPTGGWAYIDNFLCPLMKEKEDAIKQRDFAREQLMHVTRLYNELIERLEQDNREEIL